MSQLDLFGATASPVPDTTPEPTSGPQTGDVFTLAHHGDWTVKRRQADGRVVLRGKHGYMILAEDKIASQLTRRQP